VSSAVVLLRITKRENRMTVGIQLKVKSNLKLLNVLPKCFLMLKVNLENTIM
jgi:hypothetical protein